MKHRPISSRLALASLAQLVLAVATGLPLRSADKLMPRADDLNGPSLGF